MKIRKLVAVILALVLCFVVVGCSKDDSSEKSSSTESSRSSSSKENSSEDSSKTSSSSEDSSETSSGVEDSSEDSSSTEDSSGDNGNTEEDTGIAGTYLAFEGFRNVSSHAGQGIQNINEAIIEIKRAYPGASDEISTDDLEKLSLLDALTLNEDGSFDAYVMLSNGNMVKFSGDYEEDENGEISFKYKEAERTITMEKLKKLETPKVNVIAVGEDDESFGRKMELLNTDGEGTYFKYAAPAWYGMDYMKFDMCIMPMLMGMRSATNVPAFISLPEDLIKDAKKQYFTVHNGVLCTDTVGLTLKGEYKKGESFTLELDPLAAADDWYLYQNDNTPENQKKILHAGLRADETMTIEFSSGKWTWTRKDGDIVNTGSYSESGSIEGLFVMYTDEESKSARSGIYQVVYIDGSKIYYPYAFKA